MALVQRPYKGCKQVAYAASAESKMPFKHHEPNRHHIPKTKYKVTNWAEYDRGLVQRGDIRFWLDEEAIKAWIAPYRTTPSGQRKFSNFAIEATLILGAVFKMPLRQTEGFVRSLMEIMGLDLPVPDHRTDVFGRKAPTKQLAIGLRARPDVKHALVQRRITLFSDPVRRHRVPFGVIYPLEFDEEEENEDVFDQSDVFHYCELASKASDQCERAFLLDLSQRHCQLVCTPRFA